MCKEFEEFEKFEKFEEFEKFGYRTEMFYSRKF